MSFEMPSMENHEIELIPQQKQKERTAFGVIENAGQAASQLAHFETRAEELVETLERKDAPTSDRQTALNNLATVATELPDFYTILDVGKMGDEAFALRKRTDALIQKVGQALATNLS